MPTRYGERRLHPAPATPRPARRPASRDVETPTGGRHRRPRGRLRPALLTALAVVVLLLSSGTAISLTSARPPERAGPTTAALGDAPPATTPAPTGGTSLATPPTATAEPSEQTARQDSESASRTGSRPPQQRPAPPADPVDEFTASEDEVVRLSNQHRQAAGCDDVVTDSRLRTAARGHSQDMAANDYFDHTGLDGRSPFDRMRDAGYPDPAGENIAYGYRTPADVVEGWMNSDGHRRNLLSCGHRTIGVGLAYDPGGRPYWTQVFGR